MSVPVTEPKYNHNTGSLQRLYSTAALVELSESVPAVLKNFTMMFTPMTKKKSSFQPHSVLSSNDVLIYQTMGTKVQLRRAKWHKNTYLLNLFRSRRNTRKQQETWRKFNLDVSDTLLQGALYKSSLGLRLTSKAETAMLWFRVAPQRAGFSHKPIHVGFVVDKVALGYSASFRLFSKVTDSPYPWRNIILAVHTVVK
jgi:hypothetical protein